jgi:SPP1 gp7 family putative phage head morphogenesis protein
MVQKQVTLYDPRGQEIDLSVKAQSVPDLDPDFFSSVLGSGTTKDIEEKPYQLHWIVYACARVISWNLSRLPRLLKDKNNKVVDNEELKKIFDRPNPFMTKRTFFEALILYLLLPAKEGFGEGMRGGQVFIVCDSGKDDPHVDLAAGQIPVSMYPYSDEFISPEFDSQKKFIGWKLEIRQDDLLVHYKPNEIIRIYNFNPYDWLGGLSMYEPAQRAILNDIKADVWNSRTFENDAIPAGVLSSDAELTEEQATSISARWYQKYSGVGNARRVAVLGKGTKFQTIATSQKDMEFTEQKARIVDETLSVFGLNKIAIGNYEQINYATIVEGRKMLWEDTYLPIDESIMEQVNSQWINNIDPRNVISMVGDTSNIRVLKKDHSKNIIAAKTMVDTGVPAAIAYRINEVPITEDDLSNAPWLNERPIQPTSPFGNQPIVEPKVKSIIQQVKLGLDELDKIAADYLEKVLLPGENLFYNKMVRYFIDERNYMQDLVDTWLKKQKDFKGGPGSGRYPAGSGGQHDNSIDTLKQISIDHSDMISKDTEGVRKEKYHNEIEPRLKDEPDQASGKWHLAKRMISVSQEKWQEKDVKDTYKSITGSTYKPYIDESDTSDPEKSLIYKADNKIIADMFLFDDVKETEKLINKIYRPMVKDQVIREAGKLNQELGGLVNWSVQDEMIEAYVLNRAEGLAAINTTTINMYKEKISEVIAEGYQEVWNPNQFAKGIKDVISDTGEIRKNQARTIARTETGIISSDARYDAFQAEEVEEQTWVSANDEKVRETHQQENGISVKVGEEFPHTHLLHPCDPDGEPEEIINCRCVAIAKMWD